MKMNAIDWRLVNRGFRLGESVKELFCPLSPGG